MHQFPPSGVNISDPTTTESPPLGVPRATRGCDLFGFDCIEEPTEPKAITSSVHAIGSLRQRRRTRIRAIAWINSAHKIR